MENCLFCKISSGQIVATKVYEDENMFIIRDIEPKAKNHFLMIPKEHFHFLSDMTQKQSEVFGKCLQKIGTLKKLLNLENGFRCVVNQGEDAGQSVFHVHVHILSGQKMKWTPA